MCLQSFDLGAFRVMIYTDDHGPPHVHVVGKGGTVTFFLRHESRSVSIRSNDGISRADVRAIATFLEENLDILCQAWERIHGE